MRGALWFVVLGWLLTGGAMAAESPIGRGSLKLGGGGTFTSVGGDGYDSRATYLELFPSIGGFVADRILFGGVATWSRQSRNDGEYTSTSWSAGPFMRVYLGPFGGGEWRGSMLPYAGVSTELTGRSSTGTASRSGHIISLQAGTEYLITESISIDSRVTYRLTTVEDWSTNALQLGIGFSFFVWN